MSRSDSISRRADGISSLAVMLVPLRRWLACDSARACAHCGRSGHSAQSGSAVRQTFVPRWSTAALNGASGPAGPARRWRSSRSCQRRVLVSPGHTRRDAGRRSVKGDHFAAVAEAEDRLGERVADSRDRPQLEILARGPRRRTAPRPLGGRDQGSRGVRTQTRRIGAPPAATDGPSRAGASARRHGGVRNRSDQVRARGSV